MRCLLNEDKNKNPHNGEFMRFSLLPKEMIFYDLLEKLIITAREGMNLFTDLIENWSISHPSIPKIKDLEHECDLIVHEIMVKLNNTFVTPIDREDIHLLAKEIDDLIDIIHTLTTRLVIFQIQEITNELKEMTAILESSIEIIVILIKKIRSLKHSQEILEFCIQIHTLENEGDQVYEKSLAKIFQNESSSLEVIKWKEIYELIELSIDKCEDISDIIWGIVVKYG